MALAIGDKIAESNWQAKGPAAQLASERACPAELTRDDGRHGKQGDFEEKEAASRAARGLTLIVLIVLIVLDVSIAGQSLAAGDLQEADGLVTVHETTECDVMRKPAGAIGRKDGSFAGRPTAINGLRFALGVRIARVGVGNDAPSLAVTRRRVARGSGFPSGNCAGGFGWYRFRGGQRGVGSRRSHHRGSQFRCRSN